VRRYVDFFNLVDAFLKRVCGGNPSCPGEHAWRALIGFRLAICVDRRFRWHFAGLTSDLIFGLFQQNRPDKPFCDSELTILSPWASEWKIMNKIIIIGWVIELVGTALWIYGYFATGYPPLINWREFAPYWIAEFLPNIQSEVGMVLVFVGMIPIYWPHREID
jgi:hypothetical protein